MFCIGWVSYDALHGKHLCITVRWATHRDILYYTRKGGLQCATLSCVSENPNFIITSLSLNSSDIPHCVTQSVFERKIIKLPNLLLTVRRTSLLVMFYHSFSSLKSEKVGFFISLFSSMAFHIMLKI